MSFEFPHIWWSLVFVLVRIWVRGRDGILEWHLKLLIINTLRRSEMMTIVVKTFLSDIQMSRECIIVRSRRARYLKIVQSCILHLARMFFIVSTDDTTQTLESFTQIWIFLLSVSAHLQTFNAAGTIVIHFNISSRQIPFQTAAACMMHTCDERRVVSSSMSVQRFFALT